MPSNWLAIDTNFPTFTGAEPAAQQIQALHNYLYQLKEGLQYSLRNLTAENWNAQALAQMNEEAKADLVEQLNQVSALLNRLSGEVDSLGARMANAEKLAARVETAEKSIAALGERAAVLEEKNQDLEARAQAVEQRTAALEQDAGTLKTETERLGQAISGPDGLETRMDTAEEAIRKIAGAVRVAGNGTVTLGAEDQPLYLVGTVYINGVPYEGGTT